MTVRLPRNTVRLRLTLLYGGLFLGSGAALLAIIDGLVRSATAPQVITSYHHRVTTGSGPATLEPLPQPGRQARAYAAAQHAAELHQLLVYSGIALVIMAVVSVLLGWFVAGRVLRPLRTITTSVRDISASNLHDRLAIHGPEDDLKELAETFNGLLDRLEAAFDAQRQFVANASHELRTPLARERTVMEVALRDPAATVESLQAAGQRVLASGQQQERLIEALLTLARSQRGLDYREPLDLQLLTARVLEAQAPEAARRGLRLGSALGPAATLGDPRLAERLVANLVENAIRHNRPDGVIEVVTAAGNGRAIIRVANTGAEIRVGEITRLLQPFQRQARDRTVSHGDLRGGLGLGLSIVAAIAATHDAACSLRPRSGGGLIAEVAFPAWDGPVPAARRRSLSAA